MPENVGVLEQLDAQEVKDNSIDTRELEEALRSGFFDNEENPKALGQECTEDKKGGLQLQENLWVHLKLNPLYQSRVAFLWEQIDFLIQTLAIQWATPDITGITIVDKQVDNKERKSYNEIVKKILEQKKALERMNLLAYWDFKTLNITFDSFVNQLFQPIFENKDIPWYTKEVYKEMQKSFQNIVVASPASVYSAEHSKTAEDVFTFSQIKWELALQSRTLLGEKAFQQQQEYLEEYIINFEWFKDWKLPINLVWKGKNWKWETRENNGVYISGVFELYKNVIESPFQAGDTQEIEQFMQYAKVWNIRWYLHGKLENISGNMIQKMSNWEEVLLDFWESLPLPYRNNLVSYLQSGYAKLKQDLDIQREEIPKIVEQEIKEKNLQIDPKVYQESLEQALKDGEKIAMLMLLKKWIVKGTMATYANALLDGGVQWTTPNNMLAIHNATKWINLTAQYRDNKYLKLYSESTGIGGSMFNLSDQESLQILSITKSLVVNIALMYASWGLASLATKGIASGVVWWLRAVNTWKAVATADAITMFYQNSIALSKTARFGMTVANMGVEGSFFHAFNTVLSKIVYDTDIDKMWEGLTDVRGYAHSIAFMGVMRVFGEPWRLIPKLLSRTKLSQNMVAKISKGIAIPLEVGAMTGTEQVLSLVFEGEMEEITMDRFMQTVAIVVGLKLAHGSKLFEKGDKILIESMAPNLKYRVEKMWLTENQAKKQKYNVTMKERQSEIKSLKGIRKKEWNKYKSFYRVNEQLKLMLNEE